MKTGKIRWDEVHRRLAASAAALEDALSENPQRIAAAYRRRAIQLAGRQLPSKPPNLVAALIVRAGRERYAVPLKELAEVLTFTSCTALPGATRRLRGLINVRGEIRPVIDLSLVLSETPGNHAGFVLMLRRHVGLKVDEIEELTEVAVTAHASGTGSNLTIGLCDTALAVLDMDAVLAAVFSRKES
jgi:chemotaxis signal transduction protein